MIGQFFDAMIVESSEKVVTMTHQTVTAGNCFEPH